MYENGKHGASVSSCTLDSWTKCDKTEGKEAKWINTNTFKDTVGQHLKLEVIDLVFNSTTIVQRPDDKKK